MGSPSNQWGLVLVLSLVLTSQVYGQQCGTFDPINAPASGSLCPPYLAEQVWLPGLPPFVDIDIPTATRLVDEGLNSSYLWQIKAVQPLFPALCFDSVVSLLCNAAFPPCNYTQVPGIGIYWALSYPLCYSTCEYVNNICGGFFDFFRQPRINCSAIDSITKTAQFPVDYHDNSIFLGLYHYNTSCVPPEKLPRSQSKNTTEEHVCPYPLAVVDNPSATEPPCNIPCPDPTWTPKQWHDLGMVELAFSTVSFVLMFLLSVHYLLDPKCRKSLKRFQFYSFVNQMFFALAFVIGGVRPTHTWCKNSTTFADVHQTNCGAQAFFFVVFGLSSSIWWAISSSVMYIQLETRMYRVSLKQELMYHLIAIGIPVFLFGIGVQQKVVTFYWITPFCFVQFLIEDTTLDYHFPLFYIPMCVPILVAMGFIIATMVKLFKHTRSMKQTFSNQQTGGVSLMKVNIRLIVWCGSLFLFFFTIVIYRVLLEGRWQELQDDAQVWGVCKVRSELGIGSDELCPESKYPRPINYPGTVIHYMVATSVGLCTFLSFGTSENIYYFWYYMFWLIYHRKWADLHELVTNKKAFGVMHARRLKKSVSVHDKLESLEGKGSKGSHSGTSTTDPSNLGSVELTEKSDIAGDSSGTVL